MGGPLPLPNFVWGSVPGDSNGVTFWYYFTVPNQETITNPKRNYVGVSRQLVMGVLTLRTAL